MNGGYLRFNRTLYVAQMFPLKIEYFARGDEIIRIIHIQHDVNLRTSKAIHDFVIAMLHMVFLAHRAIAQPKQVGLPACPFFLHMDQRGSFRRVVPF